MTPEKFQKLRDTYFNYAPNDEFGKAEYLLGKVPGATDIKLTFGTILSNQKIEMRNPRLHHP